MVLDWPLMTGLKEHLYKFRIVKTPK